MANPERPPRVLIADDEADALMFMSMVLEGTADIVGEASDGVQAAQLAKSMDPDVAVLDLRMPGMGGLEAARAIKESKPLTQVLILTAYDDPSLEKMASKEGVYAYLIKGCSQELIRDMVGSAYRYKRSLELGGFDEPV
ncbi:MAG: hypothetical protein QOF16_1286 [Actinomycetota bacterium]|nr:hypothetical protein [Actinomycetota bacterium]